MTLHSTLAARIETNLTTLEAALAAFMSSTALSRAWVDYAWPLGADNAARPLLVGAKISLLEAGTSWGIGSNRGAAASLRTFVENIFAWLYYKDHPVEYGLVSSREDDLVLPKAIKLYLQRTDKGFEKAWSILLGAALRETDYYYSDISQYVHAHPSFSSTTSDISNSIISVPRDDGFLVLSSYADEFVSDAYLTLHRHHWDMIPAAVKDNAQQRLGPKLSKFIEI
jgi:hypothetical protein